MWRYLPVLPDVDPVTLGEGWTPMLHSRRYPGLSIKEEGVNPGGTVAARGMSMVVSMARQFGVQQLAASATVNAAGALAAYAAAAGVAVHLFIPGTAPIADSSEAAAFGAHVTFVNGSISDCERMIAERVVDDGWSDVSTLEALFRIEGDKTMGCELVEQLGWEYPDAVIYPVRSNAELASIWKAFDEMEALGWAKPGKRPKLIAVRAAVGTATRRAFAEEASQPHSVPAVIDVPREWEGTNVDIGEEEILASRREWAREEGMLLGMDGSAAAAAFDRLLNTGFLTPSDRVVLVNPRSGFKDADRIAGAMQPANERKLPQRSPVGGIITPV